MFRKGNTVPLREYFEALRVADQRALQIKEVADKDALRLAREIQTYKDEKANELRSQIEREQGERATKKELQDLADRIQEERHTGGLDTRTLVVSIVLILVGIAAIIGPHIH